MDEDMDTEPNPFAPFGMGGSGMGGFSRTFSSGMGGLGGHSSVVKKQQDPPLVHDLHVSLEEILNGSIKKMKISRKRLNPDGRTAHSEDKILEVQIKKGWKEGTKITFPKEGDETPTNIPADIVFVVKDKPHPVFRREDSDIVYPAKISLRDVSKDHQHFQSERKQTQIIVTNKHPTMFILTYKTSLFSFPDFVFLTGLVRLYCKCSYPGGQIGQCDLGYRATRYEAASKWRRAAIPQTA